MTVNELIEKLHKYNGAMRIRSVILCEDPEYGFEVDLNEVELLDGETVLDIESF